jgi:serine/threonine protein kinase
VVTAVLLSSENYNKSIDESSVPHSKDTIRKYDFTSSNTPKVLFVSERGFHFTVDKLKMKKRNFSTLLTTLDYEYIQSFASGNSLIFTAIKNGKRIAMKMMKKSKEEDTYIAEQKIVFEATLLAALKHPNIIDIKGIGWIPRPFIEVEYLQGGTLQELLQRTIKRSYPNKNLLSLTAALSIARDLASALRYLHYEVHRDATIIHRGDTSSSFNTYNKPHHSFD